MTAIAAPETGVQPEPEAAAEHLTPRNFRGVLDRRYPSTAGPYQPPVTVGESWAAAEPGIREDALRAAAWQQENRAGAMADRGHRAGWQLEARLRTDAIHAAVAIPGAAEDSAGLAEGEAPAGPADASTEVMA